MDALKEIVATATGDVSTISSALEHIRRGQFERAIVLLERGLDRSVFCLDCIRQEPDLEDQDKELIMTALKFARTHRRRYPRQPEADIEGTPLAEMQEMAKKILEGIGD